jgi:lysophospholipid acyltransferase (LPLAT)-like uncharacterized protein
MKIRAPWLIKFAAFFGTWMVRLLVGTLRYRYHSFGPVHDPYKIPPGERYLCIFWHENLLLPAYYFARPDILVLIGQHADGQLIADICGRLGFGLIRGSTTRGGVEAVRQMLRVAEEAHVAITPDGPRGPRRQVQPGVVYLAARTGMPIIPMGIGYDRPWRMKSWDCFAVPRPWTKARCITGAEIIVPENADREQIEEYRRKVEEALLHTSQVAEHWAEIGGTKPPTIGARGAAEFAEKIRRVG